MEIYFFAAVLIGCVSIGYSLVRLAFPEKQDETKAKKIFFGYTLGLIVFLPSMIAYSYFRMSGFAITFLIIYAIIFFVLLIRRKMLKLKDTVPLEKNKKKIVLPKRVLTEEEIHPKKDAPIVNEKNIKEQLFKEKEPNLIERLRKKTTQIEVKNKSDEKEEALKKLKEFAKDIKKANKNDKEDDSEVNENELNEIGEGFE